MASRGGYDGGFGAGGKIRRRPPFRAAAASPYARPAPPPAPAAAQAAPGGDAGSGWRLSRLIAGGASRLFSSVFGKATTPRLTAPPVPAATTTQPEQFDAPPSPRPEPLDPFSLQTELLDAPPSPSLPPLEDDTPEEENGGAIPNNFSINNPQNSAKDGDDSLRSSDSQTAMDIEVLLNQRTFTRTEFEYLSELLRSRTVGSNSLKPEVGNINQMHFPENKTGSRDLPVDFSIRTYSASDQVASPAELAKAYMGSKSFMGSPLRLRLHDPSSLPTKSVEANTRQVARPHTLAILPSSSIHASSTSDRLGSNYMTPNRSAIYKMSSSPYFKSAASSRDLSGNASSTYNTRSSVHTSGRQVLKRKSTAPNNEIVSVGPISKMRQRYNRVSPLLEIRPGHHGYLGSHANKHDEDFEHSAQTQKRRCLDKAGDVSRGGVDNRIHDNSFGQPPAQSSEMAAKILKQLDMLVPSQKEGSSEIRPKQAVTIDVDDPIFQKNKVLAQSSLSDPSSGAKEFPLLNNVNGASKFSLVAIDGKTFGATSDISSVLKSKSASQITSPKDFLDTDNCSGSTKKALFLANDKTDKKQSPILEHTDTAMTSGTTNKEKPPAFSLRSNAPSNLVLSSEIDRNKMLASSNGFSFPVPAALSSHTQAPPTPTMASPPKLPVEKQELSVASGVPVISAESIPRIFKPVSEEGSISNKCDKKFNAANPPISSESSGRVVSFTSNPVFNVVNSKPTPSSNGPAHTTKSTGSAVFPSNVSTSSVLSTNVGSTSSFPQFSFQSGFRTSTSSEQQSGGTEFKGEPAVTAPFSTLSSSTGGSFTFTNMGTGSSSPSSKIFACTTSKSSSSTISGSAPCNFSPQFGSASSLVGQDKSKVGSGSTPFSFSPQFGGTASSFAAPDKSKSTTPQSTFLSGSQFSQSGTINSLLTQSSASNANLILSDKTNSGQQTVLDCSNSSSAFSFTASSGSTAVTTTAPLSSPAMSSAFGSNTAFSSSPIFGSNLTTTVPLSFGSPNTASATSLYSSTSSPVFSFTSATPTIPNPSPRTPTPLFGTASPTVGLSTGSDQMNEGHMIGDKNLSPFAAASTFGISSNSPSTPMFGTPATQFASTTSASSGIFQFGQQSQPSPSGFSMGTGGNNEKAGRRILKVKRKK